MMLGLSVCTGSAVLSYSVSALRSFRFVCVYVVYLEKSIFPHFLSNFSVANALSTSNSCQSLGWPGDGMKTLFKSEEFN